MPAFSLPRSNLLKKNAASAKLSVCSFSASLIDDDFATFCLMREEGFVLCYLGIIPTPLYFPLLPATIELEVHSTVIEREIVRAEKSEKFMPICMDGLNALVS